MNRRGTRRSRVGPAIAALALSSALAAPAVAGAQAPWPPPGTASPEQCLAPEATPRGLTRVGPLRNTGDQYPVWYEDSTGTRLELCVDWNDPLCGIAPAAVPNPLGPLHFPDNFPDESFYQLADATMTTSSGTALLVMALEAAFAQGSPRAGDSIVFGRIRHRVNLNQPGRYRITHPFGVDEFDVGAVGRRAINATEDIGVAAMQFEGALQSRIGPFLRWDPAVNPQPPPGYLGDPGVPHPVVGSVFPLDDPSAPRQNVYRIEGLDGQVLVPPGGVSNCPVPRPSCIQTTLFTISGKRALVAGLDVTRASYAYAPSGQATLTVHASSTANQQLRLSVPGLLPIPMRSDGTNYFASVVLAGAAPQTITVTNLSDPGGGTSKTVAPTDEVVITSAQYDAQQQLLTIAARTSHSPGGPLPNDGLPLLSVVVDGCERELDGNLAVIGLASPPEHVTVRSRFGGSDTEPVQVLPDLVVQVEAGAPITDVARGTVVTLHGSASSGSLLGVRWEGPVPLQGANTLTPSFVVPPASVFPGTQLEFTLIATMTGGLEVSDTVLVTVTEALPPVVTLIAPTAATMTAHGNDVVTLAAQVAGGTGHWEQIAGTSVVTLGGGNPNVQTFTFPTVSGDLTFQYIATGPGGTTTATVIVRPALGLTITSAVFRAARNQWDVAGTSSVSSGNLVTVTLNNGAVLGTASVDATGAWSLRLRDAVPSKRPGPNATATATTSLDPTVSATSTVVLQ